MRFRIQGFAAMSVALSMAAAPAYADTFPSRLADSVGDSPLANTPQCAAAKADAADWSEGGFGKVLKGVGRVVIWPLGERSAERRANDKNEAREQVMQRLRASCFVQPTFERAAPSPSQRWPGAKGYDKNVGFAAAVGGRDIIGLVHPATDTIWVRARSGGPGFVYWEPEDWVRTVAWAIEPMGCKVTEDAQAPGKTREVGFVCPAGVDLRAAILSQPGVRGGERLRSR